MAKKKTDKRTKKVRSLKARNSSKVNGGGVSGFMQSAVNDTLKSIGEGLNNIAKTG